MTQLTETDNYRTSQLIILVISHFFCLIIEKYTVALMCLDRLARENKYCTQRFLKAKITQQEIGNKLIIIISKQLCIFPMNQGSKHLC